VTSPGSPAFGPTLSHLAGPGCAGHSAHSLRNKSQQPRVGVPTLPPTPHPRRFAAIVAAGMKCPVLCSRPTPKNSASPGRPTVPPSAPWSPTGPRQPSIPRLLARPDATPRVLPEGAADGRPRRRQQSGGSYPSGAPPSTRSQCKNLHTRCGSTLPKGQQVGSK